MSSHDSSRTALRRLLGDRRGVTALEFGFVGMVFFTMLLGTVELGRYQFTVQSLREFSAAAARVALINANQVAAQQASGSTTASRMADGAIKTAVMTPTNPTPLLTPASLTLTSSWATSGSGVQTVTVTVSYPFRFVAPLLPGGVLTLTDRSALSF